MKYLSKISTIVAALALVAGLSFSTSYAQTTQQTKKTTTQAKAYSVSGKVVNAQSQAVAGATVTILSGSSMAMSDSTSSLTATTDKDGKFQIENVPSGAYTVQVKADGYKTAKQQVTITQDKNVTITLEPAQK